MKRLALVLALLATAAVAEDLVSVSPNPATILLRPTDAPACPPAGTRGIYFDLSVGTLHAINAACAIVDIEAGGVGSAHVIEDEGTPLTARANLNFVGAGVVCTDSAPDTLCTISSGGGGAPSTATYMTQIPDAGLSAEQAWSLLGTGLVLNTTTTGVASIYAGSACGANTVARSTSASGVLTCSAVADADLTNNYSGVGACGANTWASTLNDNAAPTCTQPAFTSLSGTAADAQVDGSLEADEVVLAGDVDGAANANDIDEAAVEIELEGVIDLADLQGDLPLTTKTSGNYVQSLATGLGLTGGAAGSEGAVLSVSPDFAQTLAGNPAFNAKECWFTTTGTSGGGFICEGTAANTNEQLYLLPALDGADTTTFLTFGDSAGAALLGDTATGFFSTGTIDDARVDGASEADELVLVGDVGGAANANDLDEAAVETELEAVLDIPQLQGLLTDAQLANNYSGVGTCTNQFARVLNDNAAPTCSAVLTADVTDANITYAKIQDVSAASRLLGRGSAGGPGDVEEIVLGTNLSMAGTTLNATGGGGAPTDAEYWVATANAALSAERNLGLLTTGLVLNTVTAAVGVPSAYAGTSGAANQWINALNASGAGTFAQPAFTDISGSVTDAQVPNTITIDLAAAATALAANPADCATATHFAVGIDASGVAVCEAIADADIPNTITIDLATLATTATTANAGDSATGFFPAGLLEVARGGTGSAPASSDQVLVSDSTSAATWRSVPDCGESGTLNYTAASNTFSCLTDGGGGGGGNAVTTSVAVTSDGMFFSAPVAATWAAATTQIVCQPYGGGASTPTAETIAVSGVDATTANIVAGVGFDLMVRNPYGLEGTVEFRCIGV